MFERFIKERVYLKNVSGRTVDWYKESFKWLGNENPSKEDLTDFVVRMREKGLSSASCNNRIRAVNAYLKWQGSDLTIPKLKEEQRAVPIYGTPAISKILAFKPTGNQKRTHTLMLLIFDCGLRVSECIGLQVSDIDFDNLLIGVKGKGDKHRLVPMSQELRKILFRFCGDRKGLVFCSLQGKPLGRCNVLRDVKRFCKKIGWKFQDVLFMLRGIRWRPITSDRVEAWSSFNGFLDIRPLPLQCGTFICRGRI